MTAGVLTLLVLALLVALQTPWAAERARRELVARVTDALDAELHVERLEGSLLSRVTLHGLRIVRAGEPVISAERVSVEYSPWRLWRTGLALGDVVVEQPVVSLVEEADGWNIMKLVRPRPPDAPPRDPVDFSIDDLRITGARVRIDPLDGDTRTIDPLSLHGALSMVDGGLHLDIDEGTARDPDTGTTLHEMSGALAIEEGTIAWRGFRLVTPQSTVSGDVSLRTDAPLDSLDLDVELRPLRPAELAPYLPAFGELPPSAAVEGHVSGTDGQLEAQLAVTSDAGGLSGRIESRFAGERIIASGQLDTRAFDLGAWLRQPDLASRLNANVTFDATLSRSAPEDADVRFTTTAPQVRLLGYAASRVRASGRYEAGRLGADVSAQAYGASVSGRVGWHRDTGRITLDGGFRELNLASLPAHLEVPPLQSSLAGEVTLEGGEEGWRGTATLEDSTIENARVAAGAVASFDTVVEPLRYTFDGAVSGLDPSRFAALGGEAAETLARYPGSIEADVMLDARGTSLETMAAETTLVLRDTTVAGVGVDTARVKATLADGALSAAVTASVREVTESVLQREDSVPFRTSGIVDGTVRIPDITGPLDLEIIVASATVKLGASEVRGTQLDAIVLDAALAGGTATITSFTATGPGLDVTATGTAVLAGEGDRGSDLSYTIALDTLNVLEPYLNRELSGSATLEGTLTGTAERPRLQGEYSATDVTAPDVAVLAATGRYDVVLPAFDPAEATGTVTADAVMVQAAGRTLRTAVGTVTLGGGHYEIDAEVTDDRDRVLRALAAVTPRDDATEIAIRQLAATARDMTWQLDESSPATVVYRDGRVDVSDLTLTHGDSRIRASGVLGDAATATPLVARLEGVRLDDLSAFLPPEQTVSGVLNGTVTITGPFEALRVEAEVAATGGEVNGLTYESAGGTVRLAGRELAVDFTLEAGPLGRFAVAGTLPSPIGGAEGEPAPPYALSVTSSEISLGFLQPLTAAVTDITGTGRFDITMTGPAEEPVLDGTITISNAAFAVAASGVAYQQLNADLTVRGQQLVVEELTVQDDDGHTARVTGELNLPGIGPPTGFELYVSTDELEVLNNDYGDVAVSTNLTVMGDLQTPLVSGTIRLERGVLEASDLLDRLSARGYRRAPLDAQNDMEAGPFDRSSLSITLEMPDNVVVRGSDLRSGSGPLGLGDINVTVGGALTLAKETAERSELTGSVRVVRGTYQFQGRRFAIARDSEITFTGSPTNPMLNVDAEREISGVIAYVHLGGTLERPELVLTSDPPLDQGDILSLIVFNQAMNSLPTEQRVSLAARAGVLAAGTIAGPLSESVRRALDLDTFEIRPDEGAAGASVIIGRQVSERVFVGFRQAFGADEASQLTFEYRVNELMRIVTSLEQGAEGRSLRSRRAEAAGIDLIFVIR